MTNNSQDEQVLKELYKQGSKQSPSAELDKKILDYASQKNTARHGSSHFSGGWKVPLSMAASVVFVFAILVQIDQHPEQVSIPPIPEKEKQLEDFNESMEKIESSKDMIESGMAEPPADMEMMRNNDILAAPKELKNAPTQANELEKKFKQDTTEVDKSTDAASSTSDAKKRSIQKDAMRAQPSAVHAPHEDTSSASSELTVEDWLLLIEQLIARKDYAEASRQLEKFKLAHPKVNVEDLDSKIP